MRNMRDSRLDVAVTKVLDKGQADFHKSLQYMYMHIIT